jgi:nucleotide-binding universal stress UspA family protein
VTAVGAVVAWIVEGTWPACVDAVREHARRDDEVVLVHVAGGEAVAAAHGAFAGLLGRGHPDRGPGAALEREAAEAGERLLAAAAGRLGRPCARSLRGGRVEREVVAAAEGAALLVLARDGDRTRLGPHSLGPHSRFVVDHAPCPVLLVWPDRAPGTDTIPPPPPPPPPLPSAPPPQHPHPPGP